MTTAKNTTMKQRIKRILPISWLLSNHIPNPDQIGLPLSQLPFYQDFCGMWKLFLEHKVYEYIQHITTPFKKAVISAETTLKTPEIQNTSLDSFGVLIAGSAVHLYMYSPKGSVILSLTTNGEFLSFSRKVGNDKRIGIWNTSMLINGMSNSEDHPRQTAYFLKTVLLFIKYAEIEHITLQKQEKKFLDKTRYYNDSDSRITIYNCKWFTEVTRNEGFAVKGHFRMQPYKDGKRLIYIESFEKYGYHRKALKTLV